MEFSKTKTVRVLDGDACCISNIDTNFNNRGGYKNLYFAFTEFLKNFFLFILRNFPMNECTSCSRIDFF